MWGIVSPHIPAFVKYGGLMWYGDYTPILVKYRGLCSFGGILSESFWKFAECCSFYQHLQVLKKIIYNGYFLNIIFFAAFLNMKNSLLLGILDHDFCRHLWVLGKAYIIEILFVFCHIWKYGVLVFIVVFYKSFSW